jgi:nitrite reductase/ring-hydroxylating ferredoxin subunit
MTAVTRQLTETPGTAETTESDQAGYLSRRKVFAAGSAGALALGLAACGGSSSGTAGDAADPVASDPATAVASAGGSAAASGGTKLTALSAVPVGGSVGLTVGGKPIIVSQPTKGAVVAFSAICPHAGCTVGASSTPLKCPCHGSTFDPATGKNLSGPANGAPLPPLNVAVSGENVVLNS